MTERENKKCQQASAVLVEDQDYCLLSVISGCAGAAQSLWKSSTCEYKI